MSNQVAVTMNEQALSNLILRGDLKALSPVEKMQYYNAVCERVGLDPVARPFAYMTLSGKEVLYCDKGGAEQLRKLHKVSLKVTDRTKIEDVYVVTVEAALPDGRCDASTGAVSINGLKGDAMANALMKAETKAKRRATLSILGLGMLDESELETIPSTVKEAPKQVASVKFTQPQQAPAIAAPAQEQPPAQDWEEPAAEIHDAKEPVGYIIPFGKWKGHTFIEVAPTPDCKAVKEIEEYNAYLLRTAEEKGKPIRGQVAEFINEAELHLASLFSK